MSWYRAINVGLGLTKYVPDIPRSFEHLTRGLFQDKFSHLPIILHKGKVLTLSYNRFRGSVWLQHSTPTGWLSEWLSE